MAERIPGLEDPAPGDLTERELDNAAAFARSTLGDLDYRTGTRQIRMLATMVLVLVGEIRDIRKEIRQ